MLTRPSLSEFTLLHTPDTSIYTLAYNGFYEDHKSLFHIMELQDYYLDAHPDSSIKLCTLFYNTKIKSDVTEHYIAQIHKHDKKIKKLAIVGVPVNERAALRLRLKRTLSENVEFHFFHSIKEAGNFLSN